jgi:hypothetical protein
LFWITANFAVTRGTAVRCGSVRSFSRSGGNTMIWRSKVLLFTLGAVAIVVAAVIVRVRSKSAPGWALETPGAPHAAAAASHVSWAPAPLPLTFPRPSTLSTAAPSSPPAPSASPAQYVNDSHEYAQRIAQSQAFKQFAQTANIEPDKQEKVALLVALYYMDEASIVSTTTDSEKVGRMRRQLRQHMDARVRAAIPPSTWDTFEQSGLLPVIQPGAGHT